MMSIDILANRFKLSSFVSPCKRAESEDRRRAGWIDAIRRLLSGDTKPIFLKSLVA
jgi:hypothetical protein